MKHVKRTAGTGALLAALTLAGATAGLAQGNGPTPTARAEKASANGSKPGAGMDMARMVEGTRGKGMSGMTAIVPKLQEKRVTTVNGSENWDIRTGFGRNAEMAGMMIRMMTEGAGMEHMKMGTMTMDYGPGNFTETPDELRSAVPAKAAAALAGTSMPKEKAAGSGQSASARPAPVTVAVTPNPPVRGDNALDILVTDPATGKPVSGLKLAATVEMASMDMGITKPEVKEIGNGHYAATVNFSMNGPWRVTLTQAGKPLAAVTLLAGAKPGTPPSGAPPTVAPATPPASPDGAKQSPAVVRAANAGLQVTAKVGAGSAGVGDNKVLLTILDASGKPVSGAKVSASVEMTSMDMGVTKPQVKEVGNGVYATTANFSMSGPWKMTVRIAAPGQPVQVRTVPVTVKRK